MDWPGIFEREVAPALASFAAPPPAPVIGLAVVATLVGLGLLALLSFPKNMTGLVPLLMVGFGTWATLQGKHDAEHGTTRIREGEVVAKRVEKILTDDTVTGASEARLVYVVEVALSQKGVLTAEGATLEEASETVRLTTSETLYAELSEGDPLLGVSYATGEKHVHFRVMPDQSIHR